MMSFKFLSKNNRPTTWVNAQGEEVLICDLGMRHIYNIINCMLDRGSVRIPDIYEGYTKREWVQIMQNELTRRNNEGF